MAELAILLVGLALGGGITSIFYDRKLEAVEEDLANHVYAAHELAGELGRARRENEQLTEQATAMLDNADAWKNS